MARNMGRVLAQGKSLDLIEGDIRRALIHYNAVQVAWVYILEAITDKAYRDKEALVMWADMAFPKRWTFVNDDIVIDQEWTR